MVAMLRYRPTTRTPSPETPVASPEVGEAVHRETHVAASARDRIVGRRLTGDKPFEELVAFDPVLV